MQGIRIVLVVGIGAAAGVTFACHHDDPGSPVGAPCDTPDDCYPDADHSKIPGDIVCLDKVPDGYCTHLCTSDADCCVTDGECDPDVVQVCAPFENTGMMMCFVSCEAADLPHGEDPDAWCHDYADPAFGCRSTGGGANNRKVCAI